MTYKSVVIGANSFLGQEIISKELLLNNQVFGVYHKNKDKLSYKVPYYSLDEFYLLNKTIDIIYLVSAYVPEGGNIDQLNLFNVNVKLVEDLSFKYPNAKIVLASTVSVYGNSKNVITEKSALSPINTYGVSKLWAEQILKEHKNYSIVRISSMYGVGMKINTFLPRIILQAIRDGKIVLFGKGSRLQNYVHVSHVAEVMVKSAHINFNQVYLAVGEKSISNNDLAMQVEKVDSNIEIEYMGTDNSPSYRYNDDVTRSLLSLDSKVNLEEEIKKLWNWLKKF